MDYAALTTEQIQTALSYIDYEDRELWYTMGMAVKSELGESGKQLWLDWSSNGSTFKLKDALAQWKSINAIGNIRIGTLIHEAKKYGFKLEKDAPKVSKAIQKQRQEMRQKLEKEAEQHAKDTLDLQRKQALKARSIFRSAKEVDAHPYLTKKDILAHGCRVGSWAYKDEDDQLKTENNALIVPLYFRGSMVSVQAIFPNGVKKYLYGARKQGVYGFIGELTDTILICEGFATGATLHEATQQGVFVALDSGNLVHVASEVRKMYPLHRIIICADNDQYKKSNAGIKSAEKASCKVDADIVYPIFKDVSSKPTDFNDLYHLDGYSPIIRMLEKPRMYFAKANNAPVFDAFKLKFVEKAEDKLETSTDFEEVANAALTVALKMSESVPAFVSIEQIRKHLQHPKLSHKTHTSIMCRVQWSIQNRKRRAMTSIKPTSWKKHNHTVVSTLDGCDLSAPINVIFAPMGSGKTKRVIKPFSEQVDNFVAVAHRRSLIADLASNLGVKSYNDVRSFSEAIGTDKMAICLPSTQAVQFNGFMDLVNNVAIDEISQNIRFTQSKECKVIGSNQEDVFFRLQKLINESERVVVCDASIDQTTIDFLEVARPDEKLNIIEQVPNNNERSCHIYTERADFLTKIQLELQSGGKVWLAVESADRAEILNQMFGDKYRTIIITSKNSKNKKIKSFLENINEQSLDYDLVIASPAISSGVSVEHEKPHFTMIAGMASGHSICFSDFAQMLGRVRYVKDYHVCLQKNNLKYDGVTSSSILTGLRQASAMEGISLKENSFSRFSAHIEVTEREYRADFANGFIWFMQYFCFEICNGMVANVDYSLSEKMKELSSDMKEKYRNDIKIAKKIRKEEAQKLDAKQALTDDEEKQLIAYRIRTSFKFDLMHDIADLDIDMFENMPKVDRFARLLGLCHDKDDSEANITLRRFEKAQIQSCKEIFEGIDLQRIEPKDCDLIVSRIATNDKRFLYSSLRLIPSMYGKWAEDKLGNLKQYPIPKTTTKSVAALLDRFGLSWSRRFGTETPFYAVNEEQYAVMKHYAESRYA